MVACEQPRTGVAVAAFFVAFSQPLAGIWWLPYLLHARSLLQGFGGCLICCMLAAFYWGLVADLFVACSQPLTGIWWLLYLLHACSFLQGFGDSFICCMLAAFYWDLVAALFVACSQPLIGIWWLHSWSPASSLVQGVLHARSLLQGLVACEQPRTGAALYWGLLAG